MRAVGHELNTRARTMASKNRLRKKTKAMIVLEWTPEWAPVSMEISSQHQTQPRAVIRFWRLPNKEGRVESAQGSNKS